MEQGLGRASLQSLDRKREKDEGCQSKAEEYKGVQGTSEGRENLALSGERSPKSWRCPQGGQAEGWWLGRPGSLQLLYLPGR